jgi:hypothetical protein
LEPTLREPGRDLYQLTFRGGEPAEVRIAGDGGTNLDLFVYDSQQRLVCASRRADDREECSWQPVETAEFTIEVRNLGNRDNQYALWTN